MSRHLIPPIVGGSSKTIAMCTIVTVLILLCQGAAASAVTYELPLTPPTQDKPLYITFHYSGLNESTLVYLSNNTQCDTTVNANPWPTSQPAGVAPGSSVISWTRHDPATFFRVPFTVTSTPSHSQVMSVCYSLNKGLTWHPAADTQGHPSFKLWPAMPTATIQPKTAVVGQPLYIHMNNVPHLSRLVLVTASTGCRGGDPVDHYGRNATLTGESTTFALTPHTAGKVWFCVAAPPYNHWTIIPYDPTGAMTFEYRTHPTHELPVSGIGLTIHPHSVTLLQAVVSCTTIISGVPVQCIIELNATTATPVATDLSFASITDGAGVVECPPPVIRPYHGDSHKFYFSWTPQRHGRDGTFQLQHQGNPLFIIDNPLNQEYYHELPQSNFTEAQVPFPSVTRDPAIMHFFVKPEFSFIEQFDYVNLLNLDYFEPKLPKFVLRDGVPTPFGGKQNGTLDGEMRTVTLKSGYTTGTLSQTVDLPSDALNCRVTSHYYFTGDTVDPYGSVNIGRLSIIAVDGSSADIETVQTYYLYSLLRRISVVGAHKADIIDGDVKIMEQLVRHFPIRSNYAKIRVELEIDSSQANHLYWAQPQLKCVTKRPYTNPRDTAALQSIYQLNGGASSQLTNWETTQGSGIWNSDPCREQWQGVTCRHFRVVELNLANRGLTGNLPDLNQFGMLEKVTLANNNFHGGIPSTWANMTRLKEVDLSSNAISTINSENVFAAHQRCITVIRLRHNEFQLFPRQVLGLPLLHALDMSSNHVSDNIPDMETASSVLEHLDLHDNEIKGVLPTLKATTIRSADFSDNNFNGTIPAQWGDLLQAQFLDVSKNNLEGVVPGSLSKIRTAGQMVFRSANNHHTGYLPHLAFQSVDLRGNVFRCPLPYDYSWVVNPIIGLESEMQCDYFDPDAAGEE